MADTGRRPVGILLATLRAYGLEGSDAIHAARRLRSAVHGFTIPEAEGALAEFR